MRGIGLRTPAGSLNIFDGGKENTDSERVGKAGAEAGAAGDRPGVDTSIFERGLCRAAKIFYYK